MNLVVTVSTEEAAGLLVTEWRLVLLFVFFINDDRNVKHVQYHIMQTLTTEPTDTLSNHLHPAIGKLLKSITLAGKSNSCVQPMWTVTLCYSQ